MFISQLDFFSPAITLFFSGNNRHQNVVSGIIAILSVIALLIFCILFLTELFNRKNPTAYFYNKTIDDVGTFPLNSSSMFHYVGIGYKKIDLRALRVFSTYKYINEYMEDQDLSQFSHWIYNNCNKSDADGQPEVLANLTAFENSACIEQSWSVEDQRYYYKNEEGFRWPELVKGASNINLYQSFGVYIQKCKNMTGKVLHKTDCYSNEKIHDYIVAAKNTELYVADHVIDVGNYKTPSKKYFFKITNGMFDYSFSANHLNFNPVLVQTNNGLIFDKIVSDYSFLFYQNEKITMETGDTGIICCFYYWIQNNLQVYQRTYKKLTETLGNIGGMFQIIVGVANLLNFLFNDYQIVLDSFSLMEFGPKKNEKNIPNHQATSMSKLSLNISNTVTPQAPLVMSSSIKRNEVGSKINDKPIRLSTIGINKVIPFKPKSPSFSYYFKSSFCILNKKIKKNNFVLYLKNMRKQIISEEMLYHLYFILNASNQDPPQKTPINQTLLYRKITRPEKEDSSQALPSYSFKVGKIP